MKTKRVYLFVFLAWGLLCPFLSATELVAQDKEKPTTGTADTWRQSLPPEAETPTTSEENALPPNDEIQKTLLSLEQGWMEAVKVRDVDSLSQMISADFTIAGPRAVSLGDRNQYLNHALHELKLSSSELSKVTVRLFGRTAIVSGRLTHKGTAKGEDISGAYLFTDVWINRSGTWRVVSRHESQAPSQK